MILTFVPPTSQAKKVHVSLPNERRATSFGRFSRTKFALWWHRNGLELKEPLLLELMCSLEALSS
jgi:hypothetical protein